MIKTHTFSNGLRLVMEKIPSVRSVSLGIWIGTGSRYEIEKNNGISHFIEHMLFKGTSSRTAREIAEEFDSIGGHLNAFTSKEYTCYYAKVLDQHLPKAIDVLADMFFNSTFDEGELEKEKNVVLEELKMYEDTPDDVVHDLIAKATYYDHSLGYTILGQEDVINSLRPDDLRQYMNKHYTPHNTVIAVAGHFEEQELVERIESYFSDFNAQEESNTTGLPEVTHHHLFRKKDTEQAHFCLGFKGVAIGEQDIYPLILLNNILGGSMSSRLFQEIREERGLAYSIFSYHSSFKDTGSVHLYSGTAPQQLEEVYNVSVDILHSLATKGITEKELHNGKEQLKGNLMLSLESTNSRMSRIGKNELMLRKHYSLDEIIAKVEALSKERVDLLAERIFRQKHSFALISPLEQIPSVIQINRLVK
ncbi:M16 family metallopeptidase [Bacillus horti]|uniref:Zn-dependent peptidase n=1 Tax=Caldalkalibacillus horti TaxID=77523 RepID=A0ABT9VV61_9BACI|nr:pitrilysin family protein [Bacillus horti]MDQ0164765.1 putative Zn-dependent peptidase [Bacillus horti]